MTVPIKFANNAFGILAANITDSATSVTVASGEGARFPSLGSGDFFFATLIDASNNLEIVKCTARSSDVLTITRAQESTTARAYSTGDRIELRGTAQTMLELLGPISHDGTAGTGNFTIDVAGTITLDADTQGEGNGIHLKDGGIHYGSIYRSSSDLRIKSEASDKDLIFLGNDSDGGGEITALTLDMSAAGAATFNSGATFNSDVSIECGTNARLSVSDNIGEVGSGNLALQVGNSAQDALKPMGFRAEKFIFATGNSGFGTTSPETTLHVDGSVAFKSGSNYTAYFAGGGASTLYHNGTQCLQTAASGVVNISGKALVGDTNADSHIKILSAGGNSTNYIAMRNTTAADTAGARWSYLNFEGTQSGGEISTLASVGAQHDGSADDEKGYLAFTTNDGNDGDSPTERIRIGSAGQIGIAGANYGTSGQVLTSGGASGAVSWADAGGGGSTTKISTVTVSGTPINVNFDLPTSGYTYLVVQFEGMKPTTDGTNFYMRLSSNGGTGWESIYWAKQTVNSSTSTSQTSGTTMNLNDSGVSNQWESEMRGYIIFNMGSQSNAGTSFQFVTGFNIQTSNANEMIHGVGNLVGSGNTANYLRFECAQGNLDQGKFVLYGVT